MRILNYLNLGCRVVWDIGNRIGRILGRCLRSLAKLFLGIILLYSLSCLIPQLKVVMPAFFKLIEVILTAFDNWLMNQWFMARWF